MKKIVILIFILSLLSVAACQPAKKEIKTEPKLAETTGDAAVEAVGKDLSTANSVEQDLNTDELGDLDSGLADIEKI